VQRDVTELIAALALVPHPEGGFYRETYRSSERVAEPGEQFDGARSFCTAILYLLVQGSPSHLHRIKSDELWHFHAGAPIEIVAIDPAGVRIDHVLGSNWCEGQQFQVCVPAGHWFGARVRAGEGWSLAGCTVAPGFEFADFEMGRRSDLLARFPQHARVIDELTMVE
jgi:predicted cupin superfamily sugar epimerase